MIAPRLDIDKTREELTALCCTYAAEHLDHLLSQATAQEIAPHAFREHLLDSESSGREARRIKVSLKMSDLPMGQTLQSFDFAF